MRERRRFAWLCLALAAWLAAPAGAVVRAGTGGFYWSYDTPQANTLHAVVAARPGTDGVGLLAVGDASTFLIRRAPITDAASGWLAGRGRPVRADVSYRGVASLPEQGLVAVAAGDGSVLIGNGARLDSKALSNAPLNAVGWFPTVPARLCILGDGGAAYTWDAGSQSYDRASVEASLPAPPDFRRVSVAPDSKTAYAAARVAADGRRFGVLLKSTDAGQSWQELPNAPFVDEYRDVAFVSEGHGFALALSNGTGYVLETTDGGASWGVNGQVDPTMRALSVFGDGRPVAVGDAGIMVSLGRGKFESVPEPVEGLSAPIPLEDVDAAGAEAWAVGVGGVIFRTQDAGSTWTPVTRSGRLDAAQLKPWNAIQYLSEKDVLVAGDDGVTRRSSDGGRTFEVVPTGIARPLFALAAPGQRNAGQGEESPDPGVAVGAGRAILTYDPAKKGWATRGSVPAVDYHAVTMLARPDGNRAWVVGAGGVIVSRAGTDPLWRRQPTGVTATLRAVHAVPNGAGVQVVAVGDDGTILRSANGTTWTQLFPFPSVSFHVNLRGVYFRNAKLGFVVGDSGLVLRTTDGGDTWAVREAPTRANLLAVDALPAGQADDVVVVGADQTVLRSTDSGTSWTRLEAPVPGVPGAGTPDFAYRAVQVAGAGRIFIAGEAGHRLYTTNGGASWTETDGQSGLDYAVLRLTGALDGLSAGNGPKGTFAAFTDTAWKDQRPADIPPFPPIYGGDVIGDDAILVGANGTIRRAANATSSGGAAFGEEAGDIRAAVSPEPGTYVAAGAGALALYSEDGGATWKPSSLENPYGPGVVFRAIGFNPPDGPGKAVGYLAGGIPGQAVPVLFRTEDSGRSWKPLTLAFGKDDAGITGLAVFSGNVLATAENGAVYIQQGGQWRVERPLPDFGGPWLAVSANDARWYVVGAQGRAARYPDDDGAPGWLRLNTGTEMDLTAISGPPPAGFAMEAGGGGQSLRDDIRGVSMRPEGILLSDTGGLALFGDLDQDAFISMKDGVSSVMSISGQAVPDDDAYFFGDIFPPVPGPDILPGDGILDLRDTARVVRKTQGLD